MFSFIFVLIWLLRFIIGPSGDPAVLTLLLQLFLCGASKKIHISSVAQSCPTLCTPVVCSTPGLLSITNSRNLPKLMPIKSVMPSNHLILCRPLFPLVSIFPSTKVFSNESVLCICVYIYVCVFACVCRR